MVNIFTYRPERVKFHELACSFMSLHVVSWACMQFLSLSEQLTRILQCLLMLLVYSWILLKCFWSWSWSWSLPVILTEAGMLRTTVSLVSTTFAKHLTFQIVIFPIKMPPIYKVWNWSIRGQRVILTGIGIMVWYEQLLLSTWLSKWAEKTEKKYGQTEYRPG